MAVKKDQFIKALNNFTQSLNMDLSLYPLDSIALDTLQCGWVQKFEICAELSWKMIKEYLFAELAMECTSPKMCVKTLYSQKIIDEELYHLCIEILDARNRLSHLYDEEAMQQIVNEFPVYVNALQKLLGALDESELLLHLSNPL